MQGWWWAAYDYRDWYFLGVVEGIILLLMQCSGVVAGGTFTSRLHRAGVEVGVSWMTKLLRVGMDVGLTKLLRAWVKVGASLVTGLLHAGVEVGEALKRRLICAGVEVGSCAVRQVVTAARWDSGSVYRCSSAGCMWYASALFVGELDEKSVTLLSDSVMKSPSPSNWWVRRG